MLRLRVTWWQAPHSSCADQLRASYQTWPSKNKLIKHVDSSKWLARTPTSLPCCPRARLQFRAGSGPFNCRQRQASCCKYQLQILLVQQAWGGGAANPRAARVSALHVAAAGLQRPLIARPNFSRLSGGTCRVEQQRRGLPAYKALPTWPSCMTRLRTHHPTTTHSPCRLSASLPASPRWKKMQAGCALLALLPLLPPTTLWPPRMAAVCLPALRGARRRRSPPAAPRLTSQRHCRSNSRSTQQVHRQACQPQRWHQRRRLTAAMSWRMR